MSWKIIGSVAALALVTACSSTEEEGSAGETAEAEAKTPKPTATGTDDPDVDEAKETAKVETASTELSCTYPVKAGDTGDDLKERYGKDAKFKTIAGPEGTSLEGVILWDRDDKRVVEVGYDDDARTKLLYVRVYDESDWTLNGLSTGDTLTKAAKVNGAPIKFYGFEWDFSGGVFDFGGGALEKLSGGCGTQMAFGFDSDNFKMPGSLMGDVETSSADATVNGEAVKIGQFGLNF
ncbi:MAG: hypothetical protein AAF687_02995 [Pseudomonadota bacterium]